MPKKESAKEESVDSHRIPDRDLPPGITLVHKLRGHADWVGRIAWSPDGQILASPSADRTVRLWDANTGGCLRVLKGHKGAVCCVAFDRRRGMLASVGSGEVCLWDLGTGERVHAFEVENADNVSLTAEFDPSGRILAIGGRDEIWLYAPASGQLRTLPTVKRSRSPSLLFAGSFFHALAFEPKGGIIAAGSRPAQLSAFEMPSGRLLWNWQDNNEISCVAVNPLTGTIATVGTDHAIKLWVPGSGAKRPLRTLEGHTSLIRSVAFSPDGQMIGTNGANEVCLWNYETGTSLATFAKNSHKTGIPIFPGIAFHPSGALLATVGSDPSSGEDRVVHIWGLNVALLHRQPAAPNVNYVTAKIVLVGESNVGKSYLAYRIATGRRPKRGTIESTHGMRFWPLEPQQLGRSAMPPPGQRRDVVLWDMGGQDEYRLVHQLFLHDTTLALILLDPTRGRTAFQEAEEWNKRLEKQLGDRPAVKLLVGAKLDKQSTTLDIQGLERLKKCCSVSGYYETSAINGRGIAKLRGAIAKAIDWDGLGRTSRPELFQKIRDDIDSRRRNGQVVLHLTDLYRALGTENTPDEEIRAVDAVTEQLATQGLIARSRFSSGEPVLVLQLQEIERYAGSLILAARNNPRGVPALELRALGLPEFGFPGIATAERLSRDQEHPVLDSTVQLFLEHGICFQHEGLLIFPTLFAPALEERTVSSARAASLYYDFAGAIDNVYASLIAWLVLARNFGQVRLSSDRAEFQVGGGGLCGLRKVGRPGGFAHVDVYFDDTVEIPQRELFISFVEEHLRAHGVEIREHVAVACTCGHSFEEETLRKRIARGDKDVQCPVCEKRHNLVQGAEESRKRSPEIAKQMWALKTEIEKRRHKSTEQAVQVIERSGQADVTRPVRLLHLSDLHFSASTAISARLQWLLDDLKLDSGLAFRQLDYLVVSGDFTDRGNPEGFEKAYEFVSGLTREFGLSAERCVLVPGNHDVRDLREAYEWRDSPVGLKDGEWVRKDDIILAQSPTSYPLRLKLFSDSFFHKFLQKPYPADYPAQGSTVPFWDTGIQFITLNSCWRIDQFNRKRSGVHPDAVAHAIKDAQSQETEAKKSGKFDPEKLPLRIGVWHHAVAGPEQIRDVDFLGNLQKNGVRIALHGDVHEMRRDLIGYWHDKKLHVVGSGSFGARAEDRPQSTPRLYNVLEISHDLHSARVHTRCQPKPDGPWKGWNEWPRPDGGEGALPYYDISW